MVMTRARISLALAVRGKARALSVTRPPLRQQHPGPRTAKSGSATCNAHEGRMRKRRADKFRACSILPQD